MIKIVNKNKYKNLINEVEQLKKCNKDMAKENGRRTKELDIANDKLEKQKIEISSLKDIILIDEADIKSKDKKIDKLMKDISVKNQSLENTINYKEQLIIDNSTLKKSLWSCKANRNKISKHLKQVKKDLKKEQKEKEKLLDIIDAKERVIEEYKNALENAENKNQLQAAKINELTKKVNHETIEYENDGLSKQTKQSLTAKRKIRRK